MKIERALASQVSDLEAFYRITGYNGPVAPEDQVIYVTQKGHTIGVGRLSGEKDVFVLRGMRVLKENRGRGVGKAILDTLVREASSRDCFCIPYSSLRQFYSAVGFNEIKPSEAPGFLYDRFMQYQVRGLDVVIMRRKPAEYVAVGLRRFDNCQN